MYLPILLYYINKNIYLSYIIFGGEKYMYAIQ